MIIIFRLIMPTPKILITTNDNTQKDAAYFLSNILFLCTGLIEGA